MQKHTKVQLTRSTGMQEKCDKKCSCQQQTQGVWKKYKSAVK